MPLNLKIFLIAFGFISLLIILNMVRKKKIMLKHAIFWDMLIITIMICVILIEYLNKLVTFIGVEATSNLFFFAGFILLLGISLVLTSTVSRQKEEIVKLTQEIALIKNKDRESNRDKKSTK